MKITVLFLAYLNLVKNFWIALLRCPLDKKACRVYSFFFFTCLTSRLVQLNNHVSVPSFPQLAQKFLSPLTRCIFSVDNVDCWVDKTCLLIWVVNLFCTYVSMSTVLGNCQCGKKISFSKWLLTVLFVLPCKVNGKLATSWSLIIL